MENDVIDMYLQGFSKAEIAEEYNLTVEAVNNLICDLDVSTL